MPKSLGHDTHCLVDTNDAQNGLKGGEATESSQWYDEMDTARKDMRFTPPKARSGQNLAPELAMTQNQLSGQITHTR